MAKHHKLLELMDIIKPAYKYFDPDHSLTKDETIDNLCTILGQVMGFADTWNFQETYKEEIKVLESNVWQYSEALKNSLGSK